MSCLKFAGNEKNCLICWLWFVGQEKQKKKKKISTVWPNNQQTNKHARRKRETETFCFVFFSLKDDRNECIVFFKSNQIKSNQSINQFGHYLFINWFIVMNKNGENCISIAQVVVLSSKKKQKKKFTILTCKMAQMNSRKIMLMMMMMISLFGQLDVFVAVLSKKKNVCVCGSIGWNFFFLIFQSFHNQWFRCGGVKFFFWHLSITHTYTYTETN